MGRSVAELILSLRERELSRFPIVAVRTAIGRDPSCDVVIDNAGISRLHATIEAVGDSFVLRDCDSENGLTLNGEPCREGRLVHGDIIGLNKFLLRFSNQALEVPSGLKPVEQKPQTIVVVASTGRRAGILPSPNPPGASSSSRVSRPSR